MDNKHANGNATPKAPLRYERVLTLTTEIAALEQRMREAHEELNHVVREIDDAELPRMLVGLLRTPSVAPSTALATVPMGSMTAIELVNSRFTVKERIMALMADDRERKSAAIIKALKAKKQKSAVYVALTELVRDGSLQKPAYAHYRRT